MNYLIVKEINWAAGDDYWGVCFNLTGIYPTD